MIDYYEVIVKKEGMENGKTILVITDDDIVSHIYTVSVASSRVATKKPVSYDERIKRVISRLGAKDNVEIYNITRQQALELAFQASRTSVAVSILKKMRSYRRRGKTKK